jgi:hypothetical protein
MAKQKVIVTREEHNEVMNNFDSVLVTVLMYGMCISVLSLIVYALVPHPGKVDWLVGLSIGLFVSWSIGYVCAIVYYVIKMWGKDEPSHGQ